MNRSEAGFTLVEAMVVVAVTAILLAITLPLSAFWLERAKVSTAKGELSQGFGKAIAVALRNEQALAVGQPAAALCVARDNQLTVLEPAPQTNGPVILPNCAANTGNTLWTASLPDAIEVSESGDAVACMCFNSSGLLTDNGCSGCTVASTINVGTGNQLDTVNVR